MDFEFDKYARIIGIAPDGEISVIMNPRKAISDEFMVSMLHRLIAGLAADQ